MDPLSLVVAALASGAAAVCKPAAEQVVKDAYEALKGYIKRKWERVGVEALEREPGRTSLQLVVHEDLEQAQAAADRQLLEQARAVLAAVQAHDPDAARESGITIENLEAGAHANLEDLVAQGAIIVRNVKAGQDINIRDLRSGNPSRR